MSEHETTADQPAAPETPSDLIRRRIGRDVEILRFAPEQQIADSSADEICLIAPATKRVENLESGLAYVGPRNVVLGSRVYGGDRNVAGIRVDEARLANLHSWRVPAGRSIPFG